MDAKKVLLISGLMFICLIISGSFLTVEVFTRAKGEIISSTPPINSDFPTEGIIKHIYVSEGDAVKKGSILAELDNEELKINIDILKHKKESTENKLKTLNSLLNEQKNTTSITNSDLFNKQRKRFMMIKNNHHENLENLKQLVDIDGKQSKAIKTLIDKKAAGSLQGIESTQKMLRDKKDLLKLKKDFEERIVFEIEKYDELYRDIQNNIRLYQYYIERSYVRAPASGIIRSIDHPQEGNFVNRGDRFAEIIEHSPKKFKIKLNVSAKDIGMVTVDSHVRLRIDTYDHAIFGFLTGTISSVSVDRLNEENNELFYRVEVIPDKDYLESGDKILLLKYGMTLYGTMERGNVSLLSYLLKPVIKHFHEIGHI